MWFWRFSYNPTAYDDDFEDQPKQGWFFKWVLGVALPAVILSFGVAALLSRHARMGMTGSQNETTFLGINAIAYGTAASSLAIFLHCHYFWGNVYNQAWFAVLGKIIAACGLIAGLSVLIVRFGFWGVN